MHLLSVSVHDVLCLTKLSVVAGMGPLVREKCAFAHFSVKRLGLAGSDWRATRAKFLAHFQIPT